MSLQPWVWMCEVCGPKHIFGQLVGDSRTGEHHPGVALERYGCQLETADLSDCRDLRAVARLLAHAQHSNADPTSHCILSPSPSR